MTTEIPNLSEATEANKAAWNASAHLHATGAVWEALLQAASEPGFSTFDTCLTETLSGLDLKGKRAVQVGCNNGRELLSLASFGAVPAVGIDQSGAFLAQARVLSDAAQIAPDWIEANIYDLPPDIGTFDFVLITIGVLNWMPDLPRFFEIVAGLMAPGAQLVIYETHPVLEMFDYEGETPFEPSFNYFQTAPLSATETFSYDGVDHGEGTVSYWYFHSMGEIVTSCVQAGLKIMRLTEHGHSNREPEYDIYAGRAAQLPMSYTLVVTRDG